jgi:hypothetical protein
MSLRWRHRARGHTAAPRGAGSAGSRDGARRGQRKSAARGAARTARRGAAVPGAVRRGSAGRGVVRQCRARRGTSYYLWAGALGTAARRGRCRARGHRRVARRGATLGARPSPSHLQRPDAPASTLCLRPPPILLPFCYQTTQADLRLGHAVGHAVALLDHLVEREVELARRARAAARGREAVATAANVGAALRRDAVVAAHGGAQHAEARAKKAAAVEPGLARLGEERAVVEAARSTGEGGRRFSEGASTQLGADARRKCMQAFAEASLTTGSRSCSTSCSSRCRSPRRSS